MGHRVKAVVLLAALFLILLSANTYAALPFSLSDQGTDVKSISTGNALAIGNLSVEVWSEESGGTLVWNRTYTNGISNGTWNVMIGEQDALNLEYGKKYWKDYAINEEDVNFTNGTGQVVDRQFWYSPLGEINGTYINESSLQFANLTISGNMTVQGNSLTVGGIQVCLSNGTNCVGGVAGPGPFTNDTVQIYVKSGYPLYINLSSLLYINGTAQKIGIGNSLPEVGLHVGTGSGSHSLTNVNDTFVSGKLEVDGYSYFDNLVYFANDAELLDNVNLMFGTGLDSVLKWSTGQATENTLVWGLGNTANSLIFTDYAKRNDDYDHPAQTTPTLFVQSNEDPDANNDRWISITHDNTSGVIDSGYGNLTLDDTTRIAGDLQTGDAVGTRLAVMYDNGTRFVINTTHPIDSMNTFNAPQLFVNGTPILTAYTDTHYEGNRPYLSNDTTKMYFNESKMNETIDTRALVQVATSPWTNNTIQTMLREGFPTYVNVSSTMYVNGSSGYVGIGTTTPGQALTIVGNLNVTGISYLGKTILQSENLSVTNIIPLNVETGVTVRNGSGGKLGFFNTTANRLEVWEPTGGAGDYTYIYHDGTSGAINTGSGTLNIGSAGQYISWDGSYFYPAGTPGTDDLGASNYEWRGLYLGNGTSSGINFGMGQESTFLMSNAQATAPTLMLGTPSTNAYGNSIILADNARITDDYDHPAQTNPTLFVQSLEDPDANNDRWISVSHDNTTGVIDSGYGNVTIQDTTTVEGDLEIADNQIGTTVIDIYDNGTKTVFSTTRPIDFTNNINAPQMMINGTPISTASTANLTGGGATNYVSKWTGTSTLGNSLLYDNGTGIGIGTTSPTMRLTIDHGVANVFDARIGDIASARYLELSGRGPSTAGSEIRFTGTDLSIYSDLNTNIMALARTSGNVGLGTKAPLEKLQVVGNILTNSSTYPSGFFFVNTSLGRVGVNTTSPSSTLTVVGDLNVTGTSYLGNTIIQTENISVTNVLPLNTVTGVTVRNGSGGKLGFFNTTANTLEIWNPAEGAGDYVSLYHDGSNGYIRAASGSLSMQAGGNNLVYDGTALYRSTIANTDTLGLTSRPWKSIYLGNGTSSGAYFGMGQESTLLMSNTQATAPTLIWGLPDTNAYGNSLVLTDSTHLTDDYDHPAQSSPTLFVQGSEDPDANNDRWISVSHDNTSGVIDSGYGNITLDDTTYVAGNLEIADNPQGTALLQMYDNGTNMVFETARPAYFTNTINAPQMMINGTPISTSSSANLTGGGATNYLSKWTGTSTLGNSLVYDNGTNVGIGTITPGTKLDVNGTAKIQGITTIVTTPATDNLRMYSSTNVLNDEWGISFAPNDQSWMPRAKITAINKNTGNAQGALLFYTGGWPTSTATTEAMRIDEYGKVGIGTASPATGLHIGTGGTSHSLSNRNDTFVTGSLEVDGLTYFDNNVTVAGNVTITGNLNVTGISYLGSTVLQSENLSVTNILPKNIETGVTVRNGSGGKLGFFNTTSGRLEVWNPLEGANDYLSISHDGTDADINAQSGLLTFQRAGVDQYIIGSGVFYPATANTHSLGITTNEWKNVYLGEDASSGTYYGLDQDWRIWNNGSSNVLSISDSTNAITIAAATIGTNRLISTPYIYASNTYASYGMTSGGNYYGRIGPTTKTGNGGWYLGHYSDSTGNSGIPVLSWTGDNLVGIGTISPTATLEVNTTNAAGALNVKNVTNSFLFVNGSSGYVGIGTTIPSSKLQVEGGSLYVNAVKSDTVLDGTVTGINTANLYGSEGYWGIRTNTANAFNLDVYNAGAEITAMTVSQAGKVGIGTATPSEKLQVNGNVSLNNTLYVVESGKVGIGTTTPGQELVVIGDLNVTGNSYLGNVLINAENITVTNILPKNIETGVTVRNGSGGKLGFFNTTAGRLEIWNPLEGANDYLSIYNDGSNSYLSSASGSLVTTNSFYPSVANDKILGTNAAEWLATYVGENAASGTYYGLDQDSKIWYNNTNGSLYIESTAANVSVITPEFRIYDDAKAADDYVSIYHNSADAYLKAATGNLVLTAPAGDVYSNQRIISGSGANALDIGATTIEWRALYLGNGTSSGIGFGMGQESTLLMSNAQATAPTLVWGTPSTNAYGNSVILADNARITSDYDHPAQTNPTLFVQSLENPDANNDRWISISHDNTSGVIDSGYGNITLDDTTQVAGDLQLKDGQVGTKLLDIYDNGTRLVFDTTHQTDFTNNINAPQMMINGTPISTASSANLTGSGTTTYMPVWTGTSTLGNSDVIDNAAGVTVLNGSGTKMAVFNQTTGVVEIWNPTLAAGNYLQLYHDGTQAKIVSGTNYMDLYTSGAGWTIGGTQFYPSTANGYDIGATTREIHKVYMGEDTTSGTYYGLDQDSRIWYNSTNASLVIESTAANISVITPEFKVYDDAKAADDYVSMYHSGSNGYIDTGSGALFLRPASGYIYSAGSILDAGVNSYSLGGNANEFKTLYLGEDAGSGTYYGLDQDWRMYYNETLDDALYLEGSNIFAIRNTTGSSKLFVNISQNSVGINTNTPYVSAALDVNGNMGVRGTLWTVGGDIQGLSALPGSAGPIILNKLGGNVGIGGQSAPAMGLHVGKGSSSHSLTNVNDTFISGSLEVDGPTYFDNAVTIAGNLTIIGNYVNATVENQYLNGSFKPGWDAMFDIGASGLSWRNAYFSGIVNASQFLVNGTPVLTSYSNFAGNTPYLYNDTTKMYFNESKMNETIDARSDFDTHAAGDNIYLYNDTTTIYLNETKLNGTIDLHAIKADGLYLYNDTTTMYYNETRMNATIDTRALVQAQTSPWTNNTIQTMLRAGYPTFVNVSSTLYVNGTSGNIGIGTSAPARKLDVNGQIYVEGTTTTYDDTTTGIRFGSGYSYISQETGTNSLRLQVYNGGAAATGITIKQDGKVGIGQNTPAMGLHIGTGSSSHSLTNVNDTYITGLFEVDGQTNFDADATMATDKSYALGNSKNAEMRWASTQATENTLLFGLGNTAQSLILTTSSRIGAKDFDHPAQSNPTLFMQSAEDPDANNDRWISISHDNTSGVIDSGYGNITLDDTAIVSGNVELSDGNIGTELATMEDNSTHFVITTAHPVKFSSNIDAPQMLINGTPIITASTANLTGGGTPTYIPVWNGTSVLGNSVMYQSNEKIGIGTTNPLDKLNVNGSLRVDNSTGGAVLFVNSTSGNIGIGTTAPGAKLDVYDMSSGTYGTGVIRITGGAGGASSFGQLDFYNANSNNANVQAEIKAGSAIYKGGWLGLYTSQITTGTLSEQMRIDNNGNVGIGTTTPTATLDVNSTNALGALSVHNTTNNFFFVNGSSGYVGIGTTSPSSKLQVEGGSLYVNAVKSDTVLDGTVTGINTANLYGSEGYWGIRTNTANAFNLDVYNAGAEITAMTVSQAGKVGIGTTTPSEKLQVNGNVSLNNTLYVVESGKVGIGTTTPGQTLTVVGDLNVTGNSYLGNVLINAENITVSNILPKNIETGVTVRNGSGGKLGFFNTTAGRLEVWNPLEGTNDFVNINHDGTNGLIQSMSGQLQLATSSGVSFYLSGVDAVPAIANTRDLGSTALEWASIYLGNESGSGAYFGMDQEARVWYNDTNASLFIESTAANVSVVAPTFKVWDNARGDGDYVQVYHDGTNANIDTGSGSLTLAANGQQALLLTSTGTGIDALQRIYPGTENNLDLGDTTHEWRSLYLGNGTSSGAYFGMGQESTLLMSNAQATAPTMVWGLPNANYGNSIVFTRNAGITDDYDHPAQSTPTLFVQSQEDPDNDNTRWVSITHDNTSAVIDSGSDQIVLDDTTYVSGNISLADNTVGTKLADMYDNSTNFVIETVHPVKFTSNVDAPQLLVNGTPISTTSTANLTGGGTINYMPVWTGTSTLGNSLVKSDGTNVEVLNSTGARTALFNNSAGRLEVWDEAGGAGDYVSVYHDSNLGTVSTGAGNLYLNPFTGVTTTTNLRPGSVNTYDLGYTTDEYRAIYLGNESGSGAYFGLGQESKIWQNNTNGSLFIETTGSNVSVVAPEFRVWDDARGDSDYVNMWHDGSYGYVGTPGHSIAIRAGSSPADLIWTGANLNSGVNARDLGSTGNEWRGIYLGENTSSGAYYGVSQDWRQYYNKTADAMIMENRTGSPILALQGGNVGVGTTTPGASFEVYGNANELRLNHPSASSYNWIGFTEGSASKAYIQHIGTAYATAARQNDLEIYTGGDVVLQPGTGKVGIGTSAPAMGLQVGTGTNSHSLTNANDTFITGQLEVDGPAYFDNSVTINGNLTIIGKYVNATVENQYLNGTFKPGMDAMFDIGASGLSWKNAYFSGTVNASQFLVNGTPVLTSYSNFAGNTPYLYNDTTKMYFNETKMNETIDARSDFDTHVAGNRPYLWNDTTTMYFNETKMNETVDTRALVQAQTTPWTNNTIQTMLRAGFPTYVNVSSTMYVNGSSGYVGIGTTEPTAKLAVSGGDVYVDDTTPEIRLRPTADVSNYLSISQTGSYSSLQNLYSYPLALNPTGGNVGVGTATPSEKLTVNGNVSLNNTLYVVESGKVGIGTTTPSSKLTVVGDLNVTGNAYLGNVLINAENITVTNILPKNIETGVTVRNGSGGKLGFFNTTSGRLEVWNPLEGTNDYLSIYNDGSDSYLSSASGSLVTTNSFLPSVANDKILGTNAKEWLAAYIGEDAASGTYYGLDQDAKTYYNTSQARLITYSPQSNISVVTPRFDVWNPSEGSNDYVSIYQDGSYGYIASGLTGAGTDPLVLRVASTNLIWDATSFYTGANAYSLGSTSGEWQKLYMGNGTGSGIYFGMGQENRLYSNQTHVLLTNSLGNTMQSWGAYNTFGNGATSHALSKVNDTFVTGDFEVDGTTYFDGAVNHASTTTFNDNVNVAFGSAYDSVLDWSTAQATSNSVVWGLGNLEGNNIIFTTNTLRDDDYDHPAQTNPTIFVQANEDPDANNDRWISISHDNTSAVIDSGYGNITLDDTTQVAGDLQLKDGQVGTKLLDIYDNGTTLVFDTTHQVDFSKTINAPQMMINGTPIITASTANLTGGGTPTYIPVWNGTSVLANSVMYQSNSKIGIGTVTPESTLEIVKDTTYNNQDTAGFRITSVAGDTQLIAGASSTNDMGFIQTLQDDSSWTNRPLSLQPNGGNVGIGTISPGAKLEVFKNAGPDIIRAGNVTNTGGWDYVLGMHAGNGLVTVYGDGVDTGTASNLRHVLATYSGGSLLRLYDGSGSYPVQFSSVSGQSNYIQNGGNFSVNSDDFVVDAPNSRVGIGTTTPNAKFEVNLSSGNLSLFGGRYSTTVGTYSGIGLGYFEAGPTYLKSAIVQEQVADGHARGKIHILNSNASSSTNVALTDARITVDREGMVGINNANPTVGLHVGAGIPGYATSKVNDTYITGKLEVDGQTFFDSTTWFSGTNNVFLDNTQVVLGGNYDSNIDWSTNQATENTVVWGLGTTANSVIFSTDAAKNKDFDHPAQTNPAVFVQANEDPDNNNDRWISIAHDNTSGVIDSGYGNITLDDTAIVSGNVELSDGSIGTELATMEDNSTHFVINTIHPVKFTNNIDAPQMLINGTPIITAQTANLTGGGTPTYIPVWNGTSVLANSVMYQSGANIGIGTTMPTAKLYVNTTTNADGITVDGTTNPAIAIKSSGTTRGYIGGVVTSSDAWFSGTLANEMIIRNDVSSSKIHLGTGTSAPTMTITSGKTGIGTTTPSEKLTVNGNVSLNNTLYVVESGKVGIGTTTPSSKLTVVGDLNVTGNSYLGNVLINAENITVTNILPKNIETGVTVRNGSGGKLGFFNTTSGRLEVWNPLEGAGDYVSIYHDSNEGIISTGASSDLYITPSTTVVWTDNLRPTSSLRDLGHADYEWRALYLRNGTSSGINFGMGQESTLLMSNAQATAPTMVWGTPDTNAYGNSIVVATNTLKTDDYDHPAQTNPTIFVQANEDPDANNDRWISIAHDNTSAVIDSGYGNITLDDTTYVAGNLEIADNPQGTALLQMYDNGTNMVFETARPAYFTNTVNAPQMMINGTPISTSSTANLTGGGATDYMPVWTGTSTLGKSDIIDRTAGITVLNGSGTKMAIFNQTTGQLELWSPLEGANDYLSVYHDGANGIINAQSGGLYYRFGGATNYILDTAGFKVGISANTQSLGDATYEWKNLYLGNESGSGAYFGMDQEARVWYNDTNASLFIESTAANVSVVAPTFKVWDNARGDGDYVQVYHDGTNANIDTGSGSLTLAANGQQALLLTSTGTGIDALQRIYPGTENNLDLGDTTHEWRSLYLGNGTSSGAYFGLDQNWRLWYNETAKDELQLDASGNTNFSIDAGLLFVNPIDNKVGIGTTTPSEELEVAGDIKLSGSAKDDTYSGTSIAFGNNLVLSANANISLDNILYVTDTSKVGIGSSAPGYELQVAGTINATQMLINGTPVITTDNDYCSDGTCGSLTINGNLTIVGNYVNATVENQYLNGSFKPGMDAMFDIGASGLSWKNAFFSGNVNASQFLINGTPVSTTTGTVTSIAATAPYLTGGTITTTGTIAFNETKMNETIDARSDLDTHVAGNRPYLWNDTATMYFNETKMNETIDARSDLDTHVAGNRPYLWNDTTTMYFNETKMNETADTRALVQAQTTPWTNNTIQTMLRANFPTFVNVSSTMYVNGSSGLVGIGTIAPSKTLTVAGTMNVTDLSYFASNVTIGASSTTGGSIYWNGTTFIVNTTNFAVTALAGGTDNDYLCVAVDGRMYRSDAACS